VQEFEERGRRRRRRSSSSELDQESLTSGEAGLSAESVQPERNHRTKRRRTDGHNMRVDDDQGQAYSNGHTASSNGSTPRKSFHTAVNGHTPGNLNGSGSSFTNGAVKKLSPVRPPTYRGHNREEVVRILIQGLLDMGYSDAASVLSGESGYELESPLVAAFRSAVLDGAWSEAEAIL
jgi:hypothetical protein